MATNVVQSEVVVLGAGPAGYVCAIRLAQLGKKVTVVEKQYMGGVCLNVGCIPSKALIHAGNWVEKIKHASEIGITTGPVQVDLKKLMTWKEGVVKKLTGGVAGLLKANGCQVINGEAKFTSPKSMDVKTEQGTVQVQFQSCVIATGSRPSRLPGLEADHIHVLDSTSALSQTQIPKTLLCIGGGYIGLELGTFYSKIGSQVTVVEASSQLLGSVDPDLVKVVEKGLRARKVEILLNTSVKAILRNKTDCSVTFSDGKTLNFEKVLVTIGRTPNSDGLGLEKTGLKLDAKGFIPVDPARRTSVPHFFAIGDIAGQPLLAHKGSKEGIVAAEALAGKKTVFDVQAMPAVVFTDPEVATVGWTEAEAKAKGVEPQVGIFPFAANGRALSVGETEGMVKVIGDKKTGRLLGVHIVGPEASNLIAEATLAIELGAYVEDLALTVHAHPTLPETLMEASEAALGHAIHIYQKPTKPRTELTHGA